MSLNFNDPGCKSFSKEKKFGLRDDPPPSREPAYIDEKNGANWIAAVENPYGFDVSFTAIDNCIEIRREDGRMEKRCDGFLKFEETVIFVELKERKDRGKAWIDDGEKQLRTTISHFETTQEATAASQKKAYICNSEHPKFKSSHAIRMERFLDETGYVLRIEARIKLW